MIGCLLSACARCSYQAHLAVGPGRPLLVPEQQQTHWAGLLAVKLIEVAEAAEVLAVELRCQHVCGKAQLIAAPPPQLPASLYQEEVLVHPHHCDPACSVTQYILLPRQACELQDA